MNRAHLPNSSVRLSADARALCDVFASMADELENARVLGLRVEQTICGIAVRSSLDSAIVGELQHLDAILQQIAALRDFAASLATAADPAQMIETRTALDRITLGDMRSRLAGELGGGEEGWEFL